MSATTPIITFLKEIEKTKIYLRVFFSQIRIIANLRMYKPLSF